MASTSSYRDYEVEAHELVERLLHSSVEKLYREQSNQTVADQLSAQQTARKDVVWPKGNVFTVDKGLEAIQDLVKCWQIGASWKYCIDFLSQKDNIYRYAVKWSEPTRRKPVPKATASVYFYLLVHGEDDPVLVLYVIEGQRLVHRPEERVFHEVWLRNVIQNKLAVTEGACLALNDCLPSN